MENYELDEILSLLRQRKNVSQDFVCKKTKISKASLSSYENGHTQPTLENIKELANFYNVTIDYLVNGREVEIPLSEKELKTNHLDTIAYRVENRVERQTRLLAYIGHSLEEAIIKETKAQANKYKDIISKVGTELLLEDETWDLELCANHTYVAYPYADDNILKNLKTSEYEPGEYFRLMVECLRTSPNARYTEVYAKSVSNEQIKEYRNLIESHCGSAALNRVDIYRCDQPIMTEYAYYDLDIPKLQSQHPILYHYIAEHIHNDRFLAIVIAPQMIGDANFIADKVHFDIILEHFNMLIDRSEKL